MTDNTLLDLLPADAKLSPGMRVLSPQARRFVIALVELGGKDMARAATIAGYTGSKTSLQVTASRLAADVRVQAALLEEAKALMTSSALAATTTMIDIMQDPSAGKQVRLSAATKVLSFAGMEQAASTLKVEHDVSPNAAAQIAQIKELSAELGLDPRKLLGRAGVVDAEFEDVTPSYEGLEDIL